MISTDLQKPVCVALRNMLSTPRKWGWFGTEERPIEFWGGARVPLWILMHIIPFNGTVTFTQDVETFYDPSDGQQHLYPMERTEHGGTLILIANSHHQYFLGAPNACHEFPRRRKGYNPGFLFRMSAP